VIRVLGERFPTLTISLIGYIVSIPVFCDSAFVILNSLKNALASRTKVSIIAMSVALATGLYATHTFVPPTPGPIAAAGNLGLINLGLLIAVGAFVALVTALAGLLWANRYLKCNVVLTEPLEVLDEPQEHSAIHGSVRPGVAAAIAPILVPILLICMASIAALPQHPLGESAAAAVILFLGHPTVALLVGLLLAVKLITRTGRLALLHRDVADGLLAAAPILLITGAGGAFGAMLRATPVGAYLSEFLLTYNLGLIAPFLVAAGFKSAQGSTTVALIATSALMAPLVDQLGFSGDMGRVLVVLAIGAGAMTVSHVNDSFFWVVSQFSEMPVATAFRAFSVATLVQGITGIATVYLLSLVLL
jgi:GntP family gluconate:H+ symporter